MRTEVMPSGHLRMCERETHPGGLHPCDCGFVNPAPDDGEAPDSIADRWLAMDPTAVPMGGAIGRAFGIAREAYATGRLAAFREAEEIARKEAVRAVCSEADRIADAIAARAKEGSK